jgi:alginate O-acetyltransferase complex protein AlgI
VLFNSIEYLVFFISVALVIHSLRTRRWQHAFLVAASFFFYWVSGGVLILLMVFVSLVTFLGGAAIAGAGEPGRKKQYLYATTAITLAVLGFFKYYDFAAESTNSLFALAGIQAPLPFLQTTLPIGISFYTFHALSYIFDIYLGRLKPTRSLLEYSLYISFFPQLVSGPIVRARQFLPQLVEKVHITPGNVKAGLTLMSVGILKKVIIADNLAYYVNLVFSNPAAPIRSSNSFFIISGTILFGLQIYFDFSGYIDIAIGSAKILGFTLPENFNRPYFSSSPTEFWRRWNITLSSFIRDYVYIPLGGNRKGKLRTYANAFFSMLLCGIWHGASWNFFIWGAFHGLLLSAHKALVDWKPALWFRDALRRLPVGRARADSDVGFGIRVEGDAIRITPVTILKILVTQYFIFLGWLSFRVHDLSDLLFCLNRFIFIDPQSIAAGFIKYRDILQTNALLLGAGAIVLLLLLSRLIRKGGLTALVNFDYVEAIRNLELPSFGLFLMVVVLLLLTLSPNASPEFIYFQF